MYIPPNKIDPKIYYTNGGEYYYASNLVDFVGYYRKDVNGNAFAGKELTVNSPKLLSTVEIKQAPSPSQNTASPNANVYNIVLNKSEVFITDSVEPVPNSTPPTQQEYELGFYVRYFLQYLLSSQPVIIEVNKQTYFTYVNSELSKYFKNCELPWKISGSLYDVRKDNILLQGGVINSNLKSIQQAQKTMPGIESYLTDLTLYYKS